MAQSIKNTLRLCSMAISALNFSLTFPFVLEFQPNFPRFVSIHDFLSVDEPQALGSHLPPTVLRSAMPHCTRIPDSINRPTGSRNFGHLGIIGRRAFVKDISDNERIFLPFKRVQSVALM